MYCYIISPAQRDIWVSPNPGDLVHCNALQISCISQHSGERRGNYWVDAGRQNRERGNIWSQDRETRERREYIELAIEPPAPQQLCPPDRRHPRAAREQWKLPGEAFPPLLLLLLLCCWTTEPDGHFQSHPTSTAAHYFFHIWNLLMNDMRRIQYKTE